MQPSRGKGLLVSTWILTVLALILMFPVAFIIAIFSADDATGATVIWSYLIMAAPLLFLILPICAQVAYRRANYAGAKLFSVVSIASIVLCVALAAYLGHAALAMPFT